MINNLQKDQHLTQFILFNALYISNTLCSAKAVPYRMYIYYMHATIVFTVSMYVLCMNTQRDDCISCNAAQPSACLQQPSQHAPIKGFKPLKFLVSNQLSWNRVESQVTWVWVQSLVLTSTFIIRTKAVSLQTLDLYETFPAPTSTLVRKIRGGFCLPAATQRSPAWILRSCRLYYLHKN